MYALIIDDKHLNEFQKKVIGVYGNREETNRALTKRKNELGEIVWECNTRMVWIDKAVNPGDIIHTRDLAM